MITYTCRSTSLFCSLRSSSRILLLLGCWTAEKLVAHPQGQAHGPIIRKEVAKISMEFSMVRAVGFAGSAVPERRRKSMPWIVACGARG
ncbi:unnamed protein product [Durusdinium trenchii]